MAPKVDKEWVRRRGKEFAAQINSELEARGTTDIKDEEVRMFIFHRITQLIDVDNRSKFTEQERQLLRHYLRDAAAGLGDADRDLTLIGNEDMTEVMTDHFNYEMSQKSLFGKALLCAMPQQNVRFTTNQRLLGITTLILMAAYLVCLPIAFVLMIWMHAYAFVPIGKLAYLLGVLACVAWAYLSGQAIALYYDFKIFQQRRQERKILEDRAKGQS